MLAPCFFASLVLGFGLTYRKMFQYEIQTQFLELALMLLWITQNWKYSCIILSEISWKMAARSFEGSEIWEPRQVQVESIVTAALWCTLKHFSLSSRNRISKYFFTAMCEILCLSNRSLTWSRLKLETPPCKFYLYIWKLSFLWALQDRKAF